jgi:hypothetical protein
MKYGYVDVNETRHIIDEITDAVDKRYLFFLTRQFTLNGFGRVYHTCQKGELREGE